MIIIKILSFNQNLTFDGLYFATIYIQSNIPHSQQVTNCTQLLPLLRFIQL